MTDKIDIFDRNKIQNELPPEAMEFYYHHPVQFVEQQVYGVKREDGLYHPLTPEEVKANVINYRLEWQTKEMLQALSEDDYLTIYSGRGVTKTTFLALATIWFLFTRENSRVVATGPKFEQLKVTLWREVLKWLQRSNLQDKLVWSSEKLYHVDAPGLWFANILTSKDKENISGIHGDHVLYVIDEASNVEEQIIDAIIGGMTDLENKIVMCGNPTKTNGAHYNSYTRDKDDWRVLHYSSEDCARKNAKWFKRMQRYPKDSDMYRVNVLGYPPKGNPKAVINLEDCEKAKAREVPYEPYIEIGLDPASEGNDLTAIAVRLGMRLVKVHTYAKTKAPDIYRHVLNVVRKYRKEYRVKSPIRIKVDDTGYGNAIRHYLALNDTDNIEVIPCLFGGKGDDEYANNATKMWFGLGQIIDEIELPMDDELLIEELCSREWVPVSESKVKVEPKHKFKERLGRSPDRADAVILAFAGGPKKVFHKDEDVDSHIRKFDIDWTLDHLHNRGFDGVTMSNTLHYAALVLNRNLSIAGLAAIYEFHSDTLWIYKEFYQETPNPQRISAQVRYETRSGLYTDTRNVKIIGNKMMFAQSDDRRPLAEMLHREGLHLVQPEMFDEYGSIGLGSAMFYKNQIIIHKYCLRVRQEIDFWQIKTGKLDADAKGFTTALLLILSELKSRIKRTPVSKGLPDYHPVLVKTPERVRLTAWMGR